MTPDTDTALRLARELREARAKATGGEWFSVPEDSHCSVVAWVQTKDDDLASLVGEGTVADAAFIAHAANIAIALADAVEGLAVISDQANTNKHTIESLMTANHGYQVEVERLRAALKAVLPMCYGDGNGTCHYCEKWKQEPHADGCPVAAAEKLVK